MLWQPTNVGMMVHGDDDNADDDELGIVTISYNDLISFQLDEASGKSDDLLIALIGKAFGPTGLGIVLVSDVPKLVEYRQALLPLAARIPHLPDLDSCINAAALYSVGWSHGKEELVPGQPDTTKGSYYANPLVSDLAKAILDRDGSINDDSASKEERMVHMKHAELWAPNVWPTSSLPDLEPAFVQMGRLLHGVGCCIAKVCDAYCHVQRRRRQSQTSKNSSITTTTAATLERSLNCTGRLLHYFATASHYNDSIQDSRPTTLHQWCGWHKDHVRKLQRLCVCVMACTFSPTNSRCCTECPYRFGPWNVLE
jgi:hypothetical protein